MRRWMIWGLAFLAILPPHGPYILATIPLLLIVVPFIIATVWAVLTPEAWRRLTGRLSWRRGSRRLLP